MGMGTNIIVFTFILSWSFWIFTGYTPMVVNLISCVQNPSNPIVSPIPGSPLVATATCPIGSLPSNSLYLIVVGLFFIAALGIGGAILSGTIQFPNPYTLFGFVAIFLFGFITFPVDLLLANHPKAPIPDELKVLATGLFMLCYFVAFLLFYRQGGGSSW